MRIRRGVIIFLIFFLIGIFSRALFASKDFTHIDGVLYAIGSFNFSVKDATPPAPGYFLYIMSAKLLNLFTHNPHASLMLLSIFYSGLIAGVLYYFGTLLKGQMAGVISALLFLTSPLFWYKGITIFGYLNSGFFILLTAALGYKVILNKKSAVIFWFSVCFAILIGIRPQELAVMLPLYAFVLFHMKPKGAIFSIIIFIIVCTLWVIPLILMSGGMASYLSALKTGSIYVVEDSILGGNFLSRVNNHLVRMGRYFEWAYFLGIIPLVYYIGRFFYLPNFLRDKKMQFFTVWLLPTLVYNIFVQFGEIGHGMSWGLGFLLILGESVVVFCEDVTEALSIFFRRSLQYIRAATYTLLTGSIIFTNLVMFFHNFHKGDSDFYSFEKYRQFNYVDVAKNNEFLMSKVNFIKKNFDPENSLILVSRTFSYQVMYRLPEAQVIQANAIDKKDNFMLRLFHHYRSIEYKMGKDLIVPKGIRTLILFDDLFIPYFKSKENATVHELGNSYRVLTCGVSMGERIIFDYHSVRIEKDV
jgi:hypothetical protein